MPSATYTDQFYLIDPGNPPPVGTILNFHIYDLVDGNGDEYIAPGRHDYVDGTIVRNVWENDRIVVEQQDGSIITIAGTTFTLRDGRSLFTPSDDTVLENGVRFLSSYYVKHSTHMHISDLGPTCFLRGTAILTPTGPVRIEDLNKGDLVMTRDGGALPIRHITCRTVAGTGEHAPIRIAKGALGNTADLYVSPNHRMLVTGWRAELFAGADEILVAAKMLALSHDSIHTVPMEAATYMHIVLDGHHLVCAENCWSESFDIGGESAQRDPEINRQLRQCLQYFEDSSGQTRLARPAAHRYEGVALYG